MDTKCLSLVMPVYNEKKTVLETLEKTLQLDILKEVIIVDDGSTDGTRELLSQLKNRANCKVIFHENNSGKGAAIRTGLKEVSGEIVTFQDADLELEPAELSMLAEPIRKGVADVVYGSRFSGGKPRRVLGFWHRLGNEAVTFLTNFLYNSTLTDMETCYKVFKRSVIQNVVIRSNDFTIEAELTAKVLKKNGLRIYEIPISYFARDLRDGKKIRWFHGVSAIWALLKYRIMD